MQTATPAPGTNSWSRRLTPATIALGLLLVLGFAPSAFAQQPLSFGNNFFVTGDYVVAGAYNMNSNSTTISGITYTTGTINIPDTNNKGLTGTNQVPPGAQIVKALLYWQTVENAGVIPGKSGSGNQNAFFRPVFTNGPPTGYAISGVNAGNPVSFASSGCSPGSSGKQQLTTYRAEVTDLLPQDSSGNVIVDGTVNNIPYGKYEVRLPSSGSFNHQPFTLGATLVIIFRVLSPDFPLNSVVIYDGTFAPSKTSQTVALTAQGFGDAEINAAGSFSRLSYIVGNVQESTNETVYLNSHPLPLLYGGTSAFTSHYFKWDTVTWTFDDPNNPLLANFPNPVTEDASSAMTQIIPGSANNGCTSLAAVIVSTTVKNSSHDGLLDSWKQPTKYPNPSRPGYCDASVNEGVCTQGDANWVDLPGAKLGEKDVFVQLDFMCGILKSDGTCNATTYSLTAASPSGGSTTYTGTFSPTIPANSAVNITGFTNVGNNGIFNVQSNTSTQLVVNNPNGVAESNNNGRAFGDSLDPRLTLDTSVNPNKSAVDKVVDAYLAQGIHLHVNPQTPKAIQPAHAIQEQTCMDNSNNPLCANVAKNGLTAFPNQPGVVAWKGDVLFFKNQLIDPGDPANTNTNDCTTSPPAADCIPRFQPAQKDSWHYSLWGHTLGLTNWTLLGGSLVSAVQTGQMVAFTTSTPHHLIVDANQGNGRVTVAYAITNPSLNGTYLVHSVPTSTTFTIQVGSSSNTTYTALTDPNFGVVSGNALESGTISGFSDIGGADSLITLGSWGANGQPWQIKASTFMHELGHSNGLTHGGYYFDKLLGSNPKDYTPTVEGNCKSNFQSVMNYEFQLALLDTGTVDGNGNPIVTVDYSRQGLNPVLNPVPYSSLNTIDEGAAPAAGAFSNLFYPTTSWYAPWPVAFFIVPDPFHPGQFILVPLGSPATQHCDGTSLSPNDPQPQMVQLNGAASSLSWNTNQDINFDGVIESSSLGVPLAAPDGLRPHNDWADTVINGVTIAPGINLQQISAAGSMSSSGSHGFGGGTGSHGFGGGTGSHGFGGGSGSHGFGGGSGSHGFGGGSGAGELNVETANSVTFPPKNLTASEDASPRFIHLSWSAPVFGQIVKYKIYRSENGGPFTVIASLTGNPPVTTFTDTVTCDSGGFRYFVTAVILVGNPPTEQESAPSNTVSTGQKGEPLTGCYTPPVFVSPVGGSSPLAGSTVTVKWKVQDASNKKGVTFANNPGSNSLVAIGPISNDAVCVSSTVNPPVNTPRTPISAAGTGITFDGTSQFSFSWNTAQGFPGSQALNLPAGAFPVGCYRLELDLDSGQPTSGNLPASAFQVQFYLSDLNESVLINTTSLADATVGIPYTQQLQETGGVASLSWNVVPNSGSLPTGFNLDPALGKISGTTLTAGTSQFTVQVTDSIGDFGTQPLTLTVHIFVSDSQPPANPPFTATTALPNGVVGTAYSNTVFESGGTVNNATLFSWTIGSVTNNGSPVAGIPGISFQPNAAGVTNGTLSGTPTVPGSYTFTAMVTDSVGNTGTQILTLNIADALLGDLVIADGSPALAPPAGTLLRVTQDGITTGTIATISTGQPSGVAVDSNTGNIYATVVPVAGSGTPGVTQVTQFGAVNNSFVSGDPLQNPVAVAVDASKNVYVADSKADAIYKFDSTGKQVDANGTATANSFASLPASSVMHVRMAFDTNGNLIVASDKVNGASGVIEVDQINTSTGTPTVLYNTVTNAGLTDTLTAVNASAAITSFAITNNVGTFQAANNFTAGTMVQIKNLTTGTYLDGQILTVLLNGLSGTQFEANFNNPAVPSTADAGTATTSATITSFAISNNIVTFQAANNFTAGTMVQINGLSTGTYLNGQTLTVLSTGLSGAQFEANFDNGNVTVTSTNDTGTATATAAITSYAISNNIVTLQATNTFAAGTMVQINGLTTGTYLNGQTLTVVSTGLSGTQFEANFNNPNVPSTNDSGTATSQTAAYTGTFSPPLPVGSPVAISGFTNNGNNSPINSPFTVVNCTSTTLVVNNPNGVSETHAGTATFGIASVGGVAAFSDGSIDVADSSMQTIYKITTTPSLAVAPDISTTNALCCNISGMTNPSQGTTLFVTLDQAAQVLQAVSPSAVTTILSGTPLTFPNDVTWYSRH